MKRICIPLVMISLAALGANAQTVTGSGTTNTIPKFAGSSTIGDSQIHQVDDNIGINTDFIVGRLSVFESREIGVQFPQPYALYGNISSSTNFAAGVRGDANSGAAIGVIGNNFDFDGKDGGGGIEGLTSATTGFSFGARGEASGATGKTIGVFGIDNSPDGVAGVFVDEAAGNILLGGVGPAGSSKTVFRVDGQGTVHANGGFRPFGADFADSVVVITSCLLMPTSLAPSVCLWPRI